MDEIDLYIDGADFYSGSTQKSLRNGWCDFRKLGETLAQRRFGTAVKAGNIYYVNSAIGPSAELSYGEVDRKKYWMRALRTGVNPVIIERSSDLELMAARPEDRPCALVVAAGLSQESPTEIGVRGRYNNNVDIAIPPNSKFERKDGFRFTNSDLEAAQFEDTISTPSEAYRWTRYERSIRDKELVARYCKDLQERLRDFFEKQLKDRSPNSREVSWQIRCKLDERVAREFRGSGFDRGLLDPESGRAFITRRMIALFAERLAGTELIGDRPNAPPSVPGEMQSRFMCSASFRKAHEELARGDRRVGEMIDRCFIKFRTNPSHPGLSLERLQNPKGLWSLRVNDDVRIIVEQMVEGMYTLLYVGRHDDAYRWADRQ